MMLKVSPATMEQRVRDRFEGGDIRLVEHGFVPADAHPLTDAPARHAADRKAADEPVAMPEQLG
jgi:hypothetical protein